MGTRFLTKLFPERNCYDIIWIYLANKYKYLAFIMKQIITTQPKTNTKSLALSESPKKSLAKNSSLAKLGQYFFLVLPIFDKATSVLATDTREKSLANIEYGVIEREYVYNNRVVTISAHHAIVDLDEAEVFVPDIRRYANKEGKFCDTQVWNHPNGESSNVCQETSCQATDEKHKTKNGVTTGQLETCTSYDSPLFSITEWHDKIDARLLINANWFEIRGFSDHLHERPCTFNSGLLISDGVVISPSDRPNKETDYLDSIVFFKDDTSGSRAEILNNSQIQSKLKALEEKGFPVESAVSGFIIAENGSVINGSRRNANSEKTSVPRSGIGSKDGRKLHLITIQPGTKVRLTGNKGIRYEDFAQLFLDQGAYTVLNLDNSGSAQFSLRDGAQTVVSEKGDKEGHRPIPSVLAIK